MSGYDPAIGIYELTMTKAGYWSDIKNKDMHHYAEALRACVCWSTATLPQGQSTMRMKLRKSCKRSVAIAAMDKYAFE